MGGELLFQELPLQGLIVRPSEPHDPGYLANRLRRADRDELRALGVRANVALRHGLFSKPCMTIIHKGQTAAMFGVAPLAPTVLYTGLDVGAVWLLGSDDLELFSRPFLRYSRMWLERISEPYDLLCNVVDERNTVHIRWLNWLGFTFIARHDHFGVGKMPFLEFTKIT